MAAERSLDAITIAKRARSLQFDDYGITVRNLFRTRRIGWAEVRRFEDASIGGDSNGGGGGWVLGIALRDGRTIAAGVTGRFPALSAAPSETLILMGQAAQRYNIPANLSGTIERGSFPATLLGTSGTITVTIRNARLPDDDGEAVLEVIQRTEPVQPRDILLLARNGAEVEVLAMRQIFTGGRWEQVAYVYIP
jgi:hypothetical protein